MKSWTCAIGVLACVSVGLRAQAPPAQGAPGAAPTATGQRFIAIGCVSRDKPLPAPEGRGAPASTARYILTDLRADPPKVYVLEGDENALDLHVGHTVEAAGPLTVGPAGGPNANALIMKVTTLTYLSRTCVKLTM